MFQAAAEAVVVEAVGAAQAVAVAGEPVVRMRVHRERSSAREPLVFKPVGTTIVILVQNGLLSPTAPQVNIVVAAPA